jgi:hypothetical protein
MPFTLTSQQYVNIHAVTQVLPPGQRHRFLVALAGKISLNARLTWNRKVSDALLAKLIDDVLREMRAATDRKQQQRLRERQRFGEDHVDVTAKELDTLIASMLRAKNDSPDGQKPES